MMKRKSHSNGTERPAKRLATAEEIQGNFRKDLFNKQVLDDYTKVYAASKPYKHGVINDLVQPALLRAVRDEIRDKISFTPKETDIYKIHQSGDLANLDGLDDASLAQIPSMATLRDSLYSAEFRAYLSTVTGSGPLSGRKTDMAVNVYTPGCHLLCHDDVIGTRRVSYILYLTDPETPWQPHWGGALRLYPTESHKMDDGSAFKVPHHRHTVSIPPAFSQLSFFAVQPGESFHDVEEVYARQDGEDAHDSGRIRMAISGWFHIPQEGEDGYDPRAESEAAKSSSLSQLQGKSDKFDLPRSTWLNPEKRDAQMRETYRPSTESQDEIESPDLTEGDLNFLLQFMNPRYLTPETVESLAENFEEECSLRLALFLSEKFSAALRQEIEALDRQPEKDDEGWTVARPPHKHRYLFAESTELTRPSAVSKSPHRALYTSLFPSLAFRKWLALATGLTLSQVSTRARRFRRGHDYSLATGYEADEPQLEVCLGITPTLGWGADAVEVDADAGADDNAEAPTANGEGSSTAAATVAQAAPAATADGPDEDDDNVGGYEAYMAADETAAPGANDTSTGAGDRKSGRKAKAAKTAELDPAVYQAGGEGGGPDDGVLFSMPAAWNALSVVLRDRGTMRFVKYVSRAARGDRWDVVGEWAVEPETEGESGSEDEAGADEDDEADQDEGDEADEDEEDDA